MLLLRKQTHARTLGRAGREGLRGNLWPLTTDLFLTRPCVGVSFALSALSPSRVERERGRWEEWEMKCLSCQQLLLTCTRFLTLREKKSEPFTFLLFMRVHLGEFYFTGARARVSKFVQYKFSI